MATPSPSLSAKSNVDPTSTSAAPVSQTTSRTATIAIRKMANDALHIQSQLTTIYPVIDLPVDVTLEIFMWCNSPDFQEDYWTPTFLLVVCRTWREIALATPALWTTLDLDVNKSAKLARGYGSRRWHKREVERYLELRITLAHDRLLSVSLRGSLVQCLGRARFSALLRRLAPRLQRLKLEVEGWGLIDNPPSFPLLHSLAVILGQYDATHGGDPMEDIFSNAPQLQEAYLMGHRTRPIHFPWMQLTKFSGGCISTTEAWHILSAAENLTECILSLWPSPIDDLNALCHSHLQSLTLRGSYDLPRGYPPDILSLLTLPALRVLELGRIEDAANIEQLTPFLSRHSPQLRKFSFGPYSCTMKALSLECLRLMSQLTCLELSDVEMPLIRAIFRELENPGTPFLPHIQNLSFLRCASALDSADMAMLARVLPTRSGVEQIRSFRLEFSLQKHLDYRSSKGYAAAVADEFRGVRPSLASLIALAERGMHIYVGTGGWKGANHLWS
ncbi:hypothetical protein B0H17DRAFT_229648 [Mycena rosella]|uniref:F-box domain-containing protein n=1 Tax=Mycena rosella TaxID=1033263 RepID=A0AAD7H0Q7_MYCRO|nr:hypothetical protein B0H17DRAFT_229648 [Mycena rosella]